MQLSIEQVEACKRLARYASGKATKDEAAVVKELLDQKDALLYPLWKSRDHFFDQLIPIPLSSNQLASNDDATKWLTSIEQTFQEQLGVSIEEASFEQKVLLSREHEFNLSELLLATQQSSHEYRIALREKTVKTQAEATLASGQNDSDLHKELSDFIGREQASEILAALGENEGVARMIQHGTYDPFEENLLLGVVETCVNKNHTKGHQYAKAALNIVGEDKNRQLEALYLSGRNSWYLNADNAIADLMQARELAIELKNPIRQAQTAYYLSRIAIKSTKAFTQKQTLELENEALSAAKETGRTDIELLVERGRLIRDRLTGNVEEGITRAESVLARKDEFLTNGDFRILGNTFVAYALLLRRRYTEDARVAAEKIYDDQIAEHRDDQHIGMCHYLKADLYIDRMIESFANISQRKGGSVENADRYRTKAVGLCQIAREILDPIDPASLRKAEGRLLALRYQPLPTIETNTDASEDYAARKVRVAEKFLGSAPLSGRASVMPGRPTISIEDFDTLLSDFFDGVMTTEKARASGLKRSTFDYLRSDVLLCIPWRIGNTMVTRIFRLIESDEEQYVKSVGWFNIEDYSSVTHQAIDSLLSLDDSLFFTTAPDFFNDLQAKVRTIDAMTLPEKQSLFNINHVLVMTPQQNEDWLCPAEWFRTGEENQESGISLLEMAHKSVMYVTPDSRPFERTKSFENRRACIVASTQLLSETSEDSIAQALARTLGSDVNIVEWDIKGEFPGSCDGPLYIVAHNDEAGLVENAIASINPGFQNLVGLLFCSSSNYRSVAGPFVDGLAIQLLENQASTVVTSRIPVDYREAFQFLEYLLSYELICPEEAVTRYLKLKGIAPDQLPSPFQYPWTVLV